MALSPEAMIVRASALRDQLLAFCAEHERNTHGGDVCMENRAGTIAFLCHALGVRNNWLLVVASELRVYDSLCKEKSCLAPKSPQEQALDVLNQLVHSPNAKSNALWDEAREVLKLNGLRVHN